MTRAEPADGAAIVLFTRDLRIEDQPALAAAARETRAVVPLFVLDEGILGSRFASPNRVAFLLDALADLDGRLADRGGGLVVRRGDPVREAVSLARETGARAVFASADVSAYAAERERRLAAACTEERLELHLFDGTTIVAPSAVAPTGAGHYSVFTPYYRAWRQAPRRAVEPAPGRIELPAGVDRGRLPELRDLVGGRPSPQLAAGGERAALGRLDVWRMDGLARYAERHDDLAADGTSRLSPYLHFGCVSPLAVEQAAASCEPFVRQLAWRDFYHQLLAARPDSSRANLRERGDRWRRDDELLEAWKQGRTGYPMVDAGMRQLLREGWMHNRARLVVASFLAKDLYLGWRDGADHFYDWLVDGDVASNSGNWQWMAGTGADTRPYRVLNPLRQAERFDPSGDYVRRYVPELADVAGPAVHEPWKLGLLRPADYPERIVLHEEAAAAFRERRSAA